MQFAKAVTSGYVPFGGIGINDRIATTLEGDDRVWMHAYTYSAHPVGCAVALRNLQIIQDEDLPAQCAAKGDRLLSALRAALGDHPHVGDIRGKGLMCAVELVADRSTRASFPAADGVGARLLQETTRRGLFSRVKADTYVITEDQLDRTVEILTDSIRTVLP